MSTQDTWSQQFLKIRRTTLGFGVVQIILGIALAALSFAAFAFTSSDRIRNACPYWAGFAVFCSGGVGVIAWMHSSVVSMGIFTFFSAVCVILQMTGIILTGDTGGLLKSIVMCERDISADLCKCCESFLACKQGDLLVEFEGMDDCNIITGLLKEFMYGLCVLNIFGCLVCFIATILGCTAVARETGRHQGLCSRRLPGRSQNTNHDHYTWTHYPIGTDLTILPPCAPPVYHSVENFQDFGVSSCIVPPPVFDPTDLPPPYSSQNPSLAESQCSLSWQDFSSTQQHSRQETQTRFLPFSITCGSQVTSSHLNSRVEALDSQSTPYGSPSGDIDLGGCNPPWEEPFDLACETTEPVPSNDTDSSPNRRSNNCCYPENNTLTNSEKTWNHDVNSIFQVCQNQQSCSTSPIQLEDVSSIGLRSRKRTPFRATKALPALVEAEVSVLPVATHSSSPVRETAIVPLRSNGNSLGEHSIYVNSFEVMSRPPPNVQVPSNDGSELFKLDTDDNHHAKYNLKYFRKGAAQHVSSVTQVQFSRQTGERKERYRDRRRRRKQPLNKTKHNGKKNLSVIKRCALAKTQISFDFTTSATDGKETTV